MIDSSLVKELKTGVSDVLSSVAGLFDFKERITDINKAARKNELTIHVLPTTNVPVEFYSLIANGVSMQILNSIQSILSTTLASNPNDAIDFVKRNFTNSQDTADKLKNGVNGITDGLNEGASLDLGYGTKIVLENVTPLSEAKGNKKNKHLQHGASPMPNDYHHPKTLDSEHIANNHKFATKKNSAFFTGNDLDSSEKKAISIPGKVHTVDIAYNTPAGQALKFTLAIYVAVKVLPVDSEIMLDAISSAKNRSMFSSYVKMRASKNSFLRDFIFNMGEIEKQVKRDTSKNIAERMLGNMLSKGGFTRPKMLGDVTELKNYVVVLTADDADRLTNEHGINLTKPGSLHTVFSNMNILTLMVIDEAKKRIAIFESSKPSEMMVVPIADIDDANRFLRILQRAM